MSRNLFESLELDESVYSAGNAIVVHQNGRIDGGFLVHFITADFVRRFQQGKVILVLTHQSKAHWTAIANKIGYNLNSAQQKGDLVVIDLVNERYRSVEEPETEDNAEDKNKLMMKCGSINMDTLFKTISNLIDQFGAQNKCLLVVEDLSALLYDEGASSHTSVESEKSLIHFLSNVKRAVGGPTVLTSVSSCSDDCSGDPVAQRFAHTVAGVLAEVCIQVSPLTTGFSPSISGYLTVRNKTRGASSNKSMKSNHYKLEDRNIKITPIH